ncbi:uncharacterized protein [Amphiura filiformis]|uniref:uncharacterized protein isoform X1 n=1 Tax=Amphiura filiformis TaxID=82378 RepID=UPI003B22443B
MNQVFDVHKFDLVLVFKHVSAQSWYMIAWFVLLWTPLVSAQGLGTTNQPSPCDSNPCVSPDASCFVSQDLEHYICACPDGSNDCQFVPCDSNPCLHGGDCFSSKDLSQFYCMCKGQWHGQFCQTLSPGSSVTTRKPTTASVFTIFIPVTTSPAPTTTRNDDGTQDPHTLTQTNDRSTHSVEQTTFKGPIKKEEWTLFGLTKIDLLSIVLPVVIGIPSAILAIVKIYFKCKHRGREPGNDNDDDGRRGSTTAIFWKTEKKNSTTEKKQKTSRSLSLPSCNKVEDVSNVSLQVYR